MVNFSMLSLDKKLALKDDTHNNNGNMFLSGNLLYKIFDGVILFEDEIIRNINYLINNPISNMPKIYDTIFDGEMFKGYVMEYIKGSKTFRDGSSFSFLDKVCAIKDVYLGLKDLHSRGIFLGDIHSDNFLICGNKGYIIDFDYMRFKGDEFKFFECYLVKPRNSFNVNVSSRYTDNVKTMISSLSLLLDYDLEMFIDDSCLDLEKLYNDVILKLDNPLLNDYFLKIMDGDDEYFDNFLDRALGKKINTRR